MANETRLEYDRLPPVAPAYLRAATTLSGGLADGETIPDIHAELPGLEVRAENLARYRKVCGFEYSRHLPVTYPHVLAFPIHMAVLTHTQFPLKLLGLIHLRNDICQHRPIAVDETLHLEVAVGGHRDVAKGIEFDLVTRMRDSAGDVIWHETGAMLARQKSRQSSKHSGTNRKKTQNGPGFEPEAQTEWPVPADIGRRYAAVAGDYNPIHLSPWSAKLFGFPRAIATGMWVKARAAAALENTLESSAYRLSVGFKKPIFLPSAVRLVQCSTESGVDFALTNDNGDILHLLGKIAYL